MKQGIVVVTWSGGAKWANLCLDSLSPLYGQYPFYVVVNDGKNAHPKWIEELTKYFNVVLLDGDHREMGAIKVITEHTDLDEFWLIQDSIQFINPSFIWDSFENHPGKTCTYCKNPMQYYLGKWQASIIRQMDNIPLPKTKEEAVYLEHEFYNMYRDKKNELDYQPPEMIIYDSAFSHKNKEANYIEEILGEKRLSVVGIGLIKRLSLSPENLVIEPDRRPFTEEEYLEWLGSFQGSPPS
jgi:hypothetical protein